MTSSSSRYAAAGSNQGSFNTNDWALLFAVAFIWGSSFLWIAVALDDMGPGVVAFMRIALGAAALRCLPSSRTKIERQDWGLLAVVAVFGNAGPAIGLALAQQHLDSAVAGMLNGSTPLFVVILAVAITRRFPGPRQLVGLGIGLVGVVCMALPNVVGASATPVGVALVLLTMLGYGVTNTVIVGLQQRYGGVAVVMRAQMMSIVLLSPLFVMDVGESEFTWSAVGALVVLGVFGTGLARSMYATLSGSTGAARASVVTYLIPVIAIGLGIGFRGERIGAIEVGGTVLVLLGAYLTSRAEPR